ncbi:MAG TPA: PorV/PorQ family protein [bacterium]|nr:PorV/PorQ family protein [bacterium]HPN31532.1 PorV/PorQ family protein [bacterium]
MKFKNILNSVLLAVAAAIVLSTANGYCAGTTGAQFLQIGIGAKPVSLGGAYTAAAEDVYGLYWNPAGIAFLNKSELTIQHNEWIEDVTYDFAGYAAKIIDKNYIGIAVYHLSSGDIEGRDLLGNKSGDYKSTDSAMSLTWTLKPENKFALGFTGKYIKQKIDDSSASSIAADAGIKILCSEEFSFGISLLNFGQKLKFESQENKLPFTMRSGVSYKNQSLLLSLDVVKVRDEDASVSFGAELNYDRMLYIRAGYNSYDEDFDKDIYCGLGLNLYKFNFDYAYIMGKELSDCHILGIKYNF